jgi:23S rRNA pseudouridine2457 synthase
MSGFIIFTTCSATFIFLLPVSFYSPLNLFLLEYYCIVYKPFNVLSQFTSGEGKQTLKDFFDVPVDVYSAGRLDYDSEGLLVLTNDKKLNHELLNPSFAHEREYWVQIDGAITDEALYDLQHGVDITVDGKLYRTKKCKAMMFKIPPVVPERNPPIRFRKNIPTSWIKLIIAEGKNRQVRKMTAAVGFPTLRLIRYRIEKCSIDALQPGEMRLLTSGEAYHFLFPGKNGLPKANK